MCEREPTDNSCRNCRERLVPIKETASMLGIAAKSVRNQLSLGVFPIKHYKYGRRTLFKMSEVLEYIKNLS